VSKPKACAGEGEGVVTTLGRRKTKIVSPEAQRQKAKKPSRHVFSSIDAAGNGGHRDRSNWKGQIREGNVRERKWFLKVKLDSKIYPLKAGD